MFYFRLNKVKILNNRALLGKGDIQFISFVNPGESDFPMLNDFFQENDETKKMELIKQAITKVLSSRVMPEIQRIKDNQAIYFGDTGYILYKSATIPTDLNWMLLAIKSNKRVRDNAKLAEKILIQQNITSVVRTIASLASLSNPVSAAITTLSSIVADTLIEVYKNKKDKQLGLLLTSFIDKEHYPNGKRDKENVVDSTGNMFIDYTIFGYQGK
jgi:hypothetical protein